MRRSLALLLMVLLVPVPAMAQADTPLAADSAGDVMIYVQQDTPAGSPPEGAFTGLDLLAVGLAHETIDQVAFYMDVASLEQSGGLVPFSDPRYEVYFTYADTEYRITTQLILDGPVTTVFPDAKGARAWLSTWDGTWWRTIAPATAEVDVAGNRIVAIAPREAIVDSNQAPLDKGSTLTNVFAQSMAMGFFNDGMRMGMAEVQMTSPWASDRVPDAGFGDEYSMLTGEVLQSGSVFSFAPDPVRWTNGEANTFAYTIILTNQGTEDQEVRITTEGIPGNWKASHADFVTVPAGDSVNATILLSIPFAHAHGTLQHFTAVFSADGDFSKSRLGVYWPAIPQPAGHHDTLWFHSRVAKPDFPVFDTVFGGVQSWMNAAGPEVDTEDEGVPVPGFVAGPPFGGSSFVTWWQYSLSPGLRMGLDFDMDRTGTFSTQVTTASPVLDPKLDVVVEWRKYNGGGGRFGNQPNYESITLATGSSEPLAGAQSGTLNFDVELTPLVEADLIPYDPTGSSNILVTVAMRSAAQAPATFWGPDTTEPTMSTQFTSMQLPLFEYHDSLDAPLQLDRELILAATETGQEKFVNPGKTAVYRFDLTYDGEFADEFEILLTGHNTEWASIIGDTTVRLQPQETRTLALAVSAPSDARDGDEAHTTIIVRSTSNAAVEGAAHTLTKVTTAQDILDETETAAILSGDLSQAQESPGFGIFALLGAIAIALRRK